MYLVPFIGEIRWPAFDSISSYDTSKTGILNTGSTFQMEVKKKMNSLYLIWVSGCLGMPVIAAFLVYKESVLLLNNF